MSKLLAALVASLFAVTTFAAAPAAGNDTGTAASTPTPAAAAKPAKAKKAKKSKKAKAEAAPAADAASK